MSEHKLIEYKTLIPENPLKIPLVIRLLELRDGKESEFDGGYTKDEIVQTLKKLGDNSTEKDNEKSFKLAYQWDGVTVTHKGHSQELYRNRYISGEQATYDKLLKTAGAIEIEPRKVKLNVDL